ESHEDDRVLRLLRAEQAREFEYARGAGGVVVSAVMNVAAARRETAASFAATTEMIVMRADDDHFVFENRIGAFDHAGDVVGGSLVAHDISSETEVTR